MSAISHGLEGLASTPLRTFHLRHGAKMVAFAGYEMPLQYTTGVLKEHLHTRTAAGLFDVSHMGQIEIRPRSGHLADAAQALETLLPIDVLGLAVGRQRYGFLTDEAGGILDDLMVANLGDRFLLVVNAARKAEDEAWIRSHLSERCDITVLARALVALQGPMAEAALGDLVPDVRSMRFMDVREVEVGGAPCVIARSGYTGEDGFEVSIAADRVEAVAENLVGDERVAPVGLAARDTLRLEAGLCLYGSDIDATTSPAEASLVWAMPAFRRPGGSRAGGFPGASRILDEIAHGAPRRRIGLRPEGRAPVRSGAPLFAEADSDAAIGSVTSGSFGPSLQGPVAMGYLPTSLAVPGTRVFAEVRGQRLPIEVAKLPFIPARFKRS